MRISGDKLGKRFEKHWVFKDVSFDINSGEKWAIIGPNGSGKSTLLKIIVGSLTPTSGNLTQFLGLESIAIEDAIQRISFSAPYVELPEEFSLIELIAFHSKFKKPLLSSSEIVDRIGYPTAANKLIGQYSSGMKQRVRLALNFYFESDLIALDEPTSNLDENGIAWYQNELREFAQDKSVIISSNQRYEYELCANFIQLAL
jgi:ABC-type multidrug transport system ATPase subunit